MDKEEFLKRYENGERDFSGIELRDVNLSGKGFSKINLHKAKLINVNLSKTRLWEADLSEEDSETYKKLQKLSNIVKTRFKDIKIYWIGDGEIDVYIVGKIETGDWIGIRSRLLHT